MMRLDNVIEVDHDKQGDDNVSFHDDSSIVDNTDENRPLNFSDEGDVVEGQDAGEAREREGGVLYNLSDCANSDTERWVANSTDDDEESNYLAFNDATDMKDPKF
ncbi:hypothetical protein ACET3Z_001504 [Daucus carota]